MPPDDSESAKSRADGDEPSDIATHLRTVHFTLVVACAVLFISTKLATETPASLAFEQFHQMQSIVSRWGDLWRKFTAEQLSWFKNNASDRKTPSPTVVWIPFDYAHRSKFPAGRTMWRFDVEKTEVIGDADRSDGLPKDLFVAGTEHDDLLVVAKPPGSITEFEQFWNQSFVKLRVFRLAPDVLLRDINGRVSRKPWQQSKPSDAETQYGFHLSLKRANDCPIKQPKDWVFCDQTADPAWPVTAAIPTDIDSHPIATSPDVWMAKELGLPLRGAKFAQDFPDLRQVTMAYADLPLDKSADILEGERQRGGERVELVGLRLPSSALTTWGPLVILIVQIYLWLHLRALRPRVSRYAGPLRRIAWIGLYKDKFSQLVSAITMLLPAIVLWILAKVAAYRVSAVVVALASVVLAVWSVVLLALIWRGLRSDPVYSSQWDASSGTPSLRGRKKGYHDSASPQEFKC
jgi:hypothetical protein